MSDDSRDTCNDLVAQIVEELVRHPIISAIDSNITLLVEQLQSITERLTQLELRLATLERSQLRQSLTPIPRPRT